MQRCICLVTNELHPVTNGGCGTLILNSVLELLTKNFRVIVLADIEIELLNRFLQMMKGVITNGENLRIISVESLLKSSPLNRLKPTENALRQSYRFYQALMLLLKQEHIDVVEFPEYFGWAYHTVAHFYSNEKTSRPAILVRFHLAMELIDSVTSWTNYGLYRFLIYQMERYTLNNSDQVLMASEPFARWVNTWYGQNLSYRVSIPAVGGLRILPRDLSTNQDKVLFYARLAPQKGTELFVDAALRLILEGIDPKIRFVVAGPDMNQAPGGGSIIKYLRSWIPKQYQDRFEFPGNLDRFQWYKILPEVLFAVMPTRIETYCYAARELISAGVPTIVSNIPAFQDLIETGTAIGCDLNPVDLSKKMRMLLEDASLLEKLSRPWKPPPALGDVYKEIAPIYYNQKNSSGFKIRLSLTVVILAEEETPSQTINETVTALGIRNDINVWIARAHKEGSTVVFGRECKLFNAHDGSSVSLLEPTGDALCMLHAGDRLEQGYLAWAMEMLHRHPDLGFVGAATQPQLSYHSSAADDFPWDAATEALPFLYPGHLCRCVVRRPKKPFYERIDPRLLFYQEIDYMWSAIERGEHGLRRPEVFIRTAPNSENWVKIDDTTRNCALHVLLSRHMNLKSRLRIPEALKAMVHETAFQPKDLLTFIRKGGVPEIGAMRLNLSALLKLTSARLAFLWSGRKK
ncbi:MAG: glycosyltransferase family 4 protein [Desulfobacula sp.]|nr:glycosyltransferase family 4 protein [Desulfobacula sp.]